MADRSRDEIALKSMRIGKILYVLIAGVIEIMFCSSTLNGQPYFERLALPDQSNCHWFAGVVNHGYLMPLKDGYKADLYGSNYGNQAQPLLLSGTGELIWSEKPFSISLENDSLIVKGNALTHTKAGNSLRDAYLYASENYFPSSETIPDELLFIKPQYNTWIELVYDQNQQDVLAYAKAILQHHFPVGVIMIDDNWQEDYGKWNFHPGRFTDARSMISQLHEQGFKVMLWVCPFISPDSDEYRSLKENSLLLKNKEGRPKMIRWWNGVSAVLDLTHPEAVNWFKSQLDRLVTEYGVDGFKFDGGDATYYKNAVAYLDVSPNTHTELYAQIGLQYPLNEYRANWKMGGQAIVNRLRDKSHNWEDLQTLIPNMIVAGLMGYPYACPDLIGGGEYRSFMNIETIDQELIVRSAQCQALMPMMQFSLAPWRVLDKPHFEAVKNAVDLRQSNTEYIMKVVKEAAHKGEPVVRSMEYEFPHQGYHRVNDQFLIGDSLLVAPVVEKNTTIRTVLIPQGKWSTIEGVEVVGPKTIRLKVELNTLPCFYRMKS